MMKTTKEHASRRSFLKGAVAMGAAMPTAGALAMPSDPPATWDQEYDVVVVGAGGGGLAAAVEAVDRGLSVVVLEKTPAVGGSSTICGGMFACAGTGFQKEKGVQDSNDIFFKDLMTTSGGLADETLLRAYLADHLAHYDWLLAHGPKPLTLTAAAGMSVPRAHEFNPSEVIKTLRDYATSKGAKILLQTAAERLAWDNANKSIVGVFAKSRGRPLSLRAKKGVVLAAGGFSRNPKMLAQYSPLMAKAQFICGLGCQGDGILMAQAYGADILDTPYVKATYGFIMKPSTIREMSLVYYSGAIMVNKEGKRFVNESLSYKLLGDAALAQTDACGYLVFDEPIRQLAMTKWSPDVDLLGSFEKSKEEPKHIFKADSIAALAGKAGIAPAALEATVKQYNGYVDQGRDAEFGRDGLSTSYGKIVKIEKPPFYVFPATAALIATYCGVKINDKAQVIDVFGQIIKGLYAVGEMTGGFHGSAYMTGTAFGKTQVFGRIAVKAITAAG